MEADWERREPHVSVDLMEARRLLAPLRLGVRSLVLLDEGRANTNYRLETDAGPRVLRMHQRQGESLDLSLLAPVGVPTPELYFASRDFSLFEWKPGVSLEAALFRKRSLPYIQIARELAEVRRRMNGRRCRSAGLFDAEDPSVAIDLSGGHDNPLIVKTPWPSAVEGLLGWLRRLLVTAPLSERSSDRLARIVEDAEPRLQAVAGSPVLAHGDFKPSNLIVDETGLNAVIDWEFAHAGTWLSDVGQLLRHPDALPPGFADAFLDALDAPPDTALLARVLDLMNLVGFLCDREGRPKMRAGILARIDEVCDLYEARFGRPRGP